MLKPLAILIAATAALSLFSSRAHALGFGSGDQLGLSPWWNWKTIETEHFRIDFPEELAPIAQIEAGNLEEAHAYLSPFLHWTSAVKANVLLIDNADAANGLTTPVERFGMVLYATPPDPFFSTTYYDDWLRLLAFHEYTHFLNIDTTTGFYSILRYIFGDVLLPNSIWPTWMLEGLAVFDETRFGKAGRGRSAFYEGILRSAVESKVLNTSDFVTLGRINGPRPYYPGGETWYLFGYQLMNQVARESKPGFSFDHNDEFLTNADPLGIMSYRSGGRIPFFLNGNLENITGKDWYGYWDDWVAETYTRMDAQLAQLRKQPLSPVQVLTPEETYDSEGPAFSPDGHWLAYTSQALNVEAGFFIRDLKTAEIHRIDDKYLGGSLAFTPDSKGLLYSSLRKRSNYYLWSDIGYYDIASSTISWLTNDLRARDPDVSRDGQWAVFTVAEMGHTSLARAPILHYGEHVKFGEIKKVYVPGNYDRVATPKFSADGSKVFFSLHRNGFPQEDLVELTLTTGKTRMLVSDGHYNRYPAIDPQGALYYISDLTGIDNLYRYAEAGKATLLTNVTSAFNFPAFAPGASAPKAVYGTLLTHHGVEVVSLELPAAGFTYDAGAATVSPPPAPAAVVPTTEEEAKFHKDYPIKDYSIFPTILPREWSPLLFAGKHEFYVGGEILGFDQADQHEYFATGAYDTLVKRPEWYVQYYNRQLGPTLGIRTESYVKNINLTDSLQSYEHENQFNVSAAFPFQWTYSTLTPYVALNYDRTFLHQITNGVDQTTESSPYVPSVDFAFSLSDTRTTILAITAEEGRDTFAGVRTYLDPVSGENWKYLVTDWEYIRLWDHFILVPSIKASWVSHFNHDDGNADVVLQGSTHSIYNTIPVDNFDQLGIRGYPLRTFYTQAAAVAALEARFPLARIFGSPGTWPAFFENVYGFAFGETSYLPDAHVLKSLPSTGGGVRITLDALNYLPLILSVEYHYGFQSAFGGTGELFGQVGLGALQF